MNLAPRHEATLIDVLERTLSGHRCTVYLFGSRARGDQRKASDIDLAVDTPDSIECELARARQLLEESTIPYEVDLVDLKDTSHTFRQQVQQEGVVVWKS